MWQGLTRYVLQHVQGVAKGTLTVGDAVLFLSLLQQLYAPLNYFGSYYRSDSRASMPLCPSPARYGFPCMGLLRQTISRILCQQDQRPIF